MSIWVVPMIAVGMKTARLQCRQNQATMLYTHKPLIHAFTQSTRVIGVL